MGSLNTPKPYFSARDAMSTFRMRLSQGIVGSQSRKLIKITPMSGPGESNIATLRLRRDEDSGIESGELF